MLGKLGCRDTCETEFTREAVKLQKTVRYAITLMLACLSNFKAINNPG